MLSVLFGFVMGEGSEGLGLDMDIELVIKNERIGFKQLAKKQSKCYIYRLLELNSCDCFEKPLTLVATIKYAPSQQYEQITSVDDLVRKLSKRTFGLYSEKTLCLIKREIIIKDPMDAVYRFSPLGYIWMKLTSRQCQLVINEVRLATWLSQNEELRGFDSKSSL